MKPYNSIARQAIFTKYYGPTNTKASKVKAYCERGSITLSLADKLSVEENHIAACAALLAKFAKEDGNDKSWGKIENLAFGGSPRHEKSHYAFVNVTL